MYIEISSNNRGHERVFVSWERFDIIQITYRTIQYNRFSISDANLMSLGLFKIQSSLEGDTWSTKYTLHKNEQYTSTTTDWTILDLDFTEKIHGIKLIYDHIDTPHADMCFSNITIPHFV